MAMGWIMTIIVGAIAGFFANKIVSGSGQGFLTNLIVGVIGAVAGNFVFNFFGMGGTQAGAWIYSIIVATVGAVIVLWLYNAVVGKRA